MRGRQQQLQKMKLYGSEYKQRGRQNEAEEVELMGGRRERGVWQTSGDTSLA